MYVHVMAGHLRIPDPVQEIGWVRDHREDDGHQ